MVFQAETQPKIFSIELLPSTGMCVRCGPGEAGLLVSKILSFDRGGPRDFKPYVNNEEATRKKLLRDVWKKGDSVFSTGDVMTMDEHGWLFFQVNRAWEG